MPVFRLPAIALLLALAGCSSTAPADSCSVLFGRPVAATGLTDAQCAPGCSCGGTTRTPPVYDAPFVAVMSRQVVYGASSGLTDYAACFLGVGFSAFSSSSGSSRLMVM